MRGLRLLTRSGAALALAAALLGPSAALAQLAPPSGTVSGGGPATIADGASITLGAKGNAADINPAATDTLMAFTKGIIQLLLQPSVLADGNLAAQVGTVGLVDSAGVNLATITAAGALKVDGSGVTQPVSVSGGPTAANQTTANTSLATIATNTGTTAGAISGGAMKTTRAGATYTEATQAVSATTWTTIVSAATRAGLILSDPVGHGCFWSTATSPSGVQGFAFSLSGAPGTESFLNGVPQNTVKAYCASATTLSYVTF